MKRFKTCMIACLSLTMVGASCYADETRATSPRRQIAMSMPHAKSDKSAVTAGKGQDAQVEAVNDFLKRAGGMFAKVETSTVQRGREFAGWIATVFRKGPARLTPVATPRVTHRDFVSIEDPTPARRIRQYVSPEGRVQTVVGR